MPAIVIKAMLIARNTDKLLFSRGYDEVKKEAFLRPLGGHVEFGENAEATIRREMQEELASDVDGIRLLEVIENRFTYRGEPCHEVIFMFEGKLTEQSYYQKENFTFTEGKGEGKAGWFSKEDVERENLAIYPPFNYF